MMNELQNPSNSTIRTILNLLTNFQPQPTKWLQKCHVNIKDIYLNAIISHVNATSDMIFCNLQPYS